LRNTKFLFSYALRSPLDTDLANHKWFGAYKDARARYAILKKLDATNAPPNGDAF